MTRRQSGLISLPPLAAQQAFAPDTAPLRFAAQVKRWPLGRNRLEESSSYLTVSREVRSSSEGKGELIFQPILDETPTDTENAQITAVFAVNHVS